MQKLAKLRKKIDQIDKKIANLLQARFEVVTEIKKIKKTEKLPKIDKKREKEILANLETNYEKKIFKKILIESRKLRG